jgi:hypothetical protein
MTDEHDDQKREGEGCKPAPKSGPSKTVREVIVKHLDEPPPSGKRTIHPRRPAPIVPTREERTADESAENTDSKKTASE